MCDIGDISFSKNDRCACRSPKPPIGGINDRVFEDRHAKIADANHIINKIAVAGR